MPKCSLETMNSRKEELVDACDKLYQTKPFGETTLKE